MYRKLKRLVVGGLAGIGGLVVTMVAAVIGSSYVQYHARKNYRLIDQYEGQPYD